MANMYDGFTIKVDPVDLQRASDELEKKLKTLHTLFDTMIGRVESTANYWQGDASEKYRKDFKNDRSEMEEAFARIKEHVTDLYNIAGIYTGVEKQVTEISENLSSDVIV